MLFGITGLTVVTIIAYLRASQAHTRAIVAGFWLAGSALQVALTTGVFGA